jgi:hypothetical protein
MPTFSADLERSLHRALAFANERHHSYSTLEHLLLALTEDRDAVEVIVGCNGKIDVLRAKLVQYIDNELTGLVTETADDSKPTESFQRVIQRSVIHVQSSGREEVSGANVIVAIFAERESHAAFFLQEQDITRYDAVNYVTHNVAKVSSDREIPLFALPRIIEKSISRTLESAPEFHAHRGRIRFRQAPSTGRITERKAAVLERCAELQSKCGRRENEQPELKQLVDRYAATLKALRKDRGAYRLLLAGLEIETLVKSKIESMVDAERNIPLDADLLFAIRSLLVAHAGLVVLFPDIKNTADELDRYRQFSESVDALRDRIFDPVFDKLASSRGIFDEETQKITQEINSLSETSPPNVAPTQGTAATKHSWLRGALASIGQYLVRQTKEGTKVARDTVIKEKVSEVLKNPNRLTSSILKFIDDAKDALLSLAEKFPSAFGWISFLMSLFGFK